MAASLVILNPCAGQGRAAHFHARLRQFAHGRPDLSLQETHQPGDATRMAATAAARGFDLVVAAGGDGTAHEVLHGLMDAAAIRRPRLGLVLLGSANDLGRGLGLPADVDDACRRLAQGRTRTIDLGQITDEDGRITYFALSSGVGFLGAVARERARVPQMRGAQLYVVSALRAMAGYRPQDTVCFRPGDGLPLRQQIATLSINNTPSVGGLPLSPEARLDDGLLDVVYLQQVSKSRLVQLLVATIMGRHLQAPECALLQTDQLVIEMPAHTPVHADGEMVTVGPGRGRETRPSAPPMRRLNVRVLPGALRVVV